MNGSFFKLMYRKVRGCCTGESAAIGFLVMVCGGLPVSAEIVAGRQVNELVSTWAYANPGGYFPEREWQANLQSYDQIERSWGEATYRYRYAFPVDGMSIGIEVYWQPKYEMVDSPVAISLAGAGLAEGVAPGQRSALTEAGYATVEGVTFGDSRAAVRRVYGVPEQLLNWPFEVFYVPRHDLEQLDFYGRLGIAFGYEFPGSADPMVATIYLVRPGGLTAVREMSWGRVKRDGFERVVLERGVAGGSGFSICPNGSHD